MARQQQPCRVQRTTDSPRLSGSHAARGRRDPPHYSFPDGIGRPRRPEEKSSRLGHARDCNARKPAAGNDSAVPRHDRFRHRGVVVPAVPCHANDGQMEGRMVTTATS